ncbi:MAG: hypothetical protein Q4F70_05685, partial [Clostridia bacterium]|nr:hypothetical protein [Clostridia bacterium]
DIWDHKDIFAYLEVDNENGHEFSTIMVIEDSSGHKYFAGVDYSYYKVMDSIMTSFKIIAIITFAVLFGILTLVYFVIKKKINKPATLISDTMQNYIKDGKREAVELPISGQDEFAM